MKLKPFFQGKLDVFCAIYAVLNGLRITHNLRTSKAMEIFRDTLLGLSGQPALFQAVVKNETDFVALVDAMLAAETSKRRLEVLKPFGKSPLADVNDFWQVTDLWLNPEGKPGANRAVIVRFCRFLDIKKPPVIKHWTTVDSITAKNMHLFDSSHEAEAIQNLAKDSIVTRPRDIDEEHKILLQPDTARFLRLPY